ncbi:MAG: TIGR02677 family protein [bacterium]|nr:TIGR02677 family protein [bacterium]MDE0288127.1 TIGR02677 family protein [bacterium]MDE0438429.1 TIGR02677 family protein [bacterium]
MKDTGGGGLSSSGGDAARARQLFRYLAGEGWREYRAILGVFAGTFFTEFTPDEVAADPIVATTGVDPAVVPDRLESLRTWGNLTVSSSVGNPSSLDDYYRRRNRYLITRAGQEVYDLTERVLTGIDEIADVQAGRLRDLDRVLSELGDHGDTGFEYVEGEVLADRVRTVFDVHERFTTELTQFFAELNLWQSRYDLDADEVQLFAGVLVTYVSEQLREIERMVRPISTSLERILPRLASLLPALHHGLAVRVDDVGLADTVSVRRLPGTTTDDWERLAAWFITGSGSVSRLDQLTRQAVAAVRTLTANVTRLSRVGLGAVSRRADFVRLAGFFDQSASNGQTHEIAAAAFGLGSCRRLAMLSSDADDPAPTVTPWRDAPRAIVPVPLRIRGNTGQRGRATPIRDRARERNLLRRSRELDRAAREMAASELLACGGEDGRIGGASISVASFSMLRDLISRSGFGAEAGAGVRSATHLGVRCEVRRVAGAETVVECPEGRFVMRDLIVTVVADDRPDRVGAPT